MSAGGTTSGRSASTPSTSPKPSRDSVRLNDEGGRVLIALGILEAVEAYTRVSEMVERLDGTYIHDDDWDEEQFFLEPWRIVGDSDEG